MYIPIYSVYIYIHYTYKYTIQVSQILAAPQTTLKKLKISFGWQVLVLENLENAARTSTFRAAICFFAKLFGGIIFCP